MMKRALAIAGLASVAVLATTPSVFAANMKGEAVVLRTLDKVTARTKDFTVPIGDTLTYGSLEIDAVHCESRPPEDLPETFAFLKIRDNRQDGSGQKSESETVFSGWMFMTRPAVHALDHGVYDVWVVGCKIPSSVMQRALGVRR